MRSNKNSIILILFISFSFAFKAQVIDKVIAQVGDNIILLSDIQKRKLSFLQEGKEIDENTDCVLLEELL